MSRADGGATWQRSELPAWGEISFSSVTTGWLAGGVTGSDLHVTRDGGASWSPEASRFERSTRVARFGAPEVADGRITLPVTYVAPDGGRDAEVVYFVSGNGGLDWVPESQLALPDSGVLVVAALTEIVGRDTEIAADPGKAELYVSSDRGATFSRRPTGTVAGLVRISFATATDGRVLARAGRCSAGKTDCRMVEQLRSTRDGGATWRTLSPT